MHCMGGLAMAVRAGDGKTKLAKIDSYYNLASMMRWYFFAMKAPRGLSEQLASYKQSSLHTCRQSLSLFVGVIDLGVQTAYRGDASVILFI